MSALTPEQVERLTDWWLHADNPGLEDIQALIAEAVDQARAEERERIAAAIEQMVTDCTDPDVPREKWGRRVNGWTTGMERAAIIARSQP